MDETIKQFHYNMNRVKNMGVIYSSIKSQTTQILDLSDILRAELVFAVSCLDQYIHEVVRIGMIEAYDGKRKQTASFLQYNCSLNSILVSHQYKDSKDWLDIEIRKHHGWKSFEHPKKISEAISLITEKDIWEEIGKSINEDPRNIKKELSLIIDRRNKIAHEFDLDPTFRNCRWEIDLLLVDKSIAYIEKIVDSIHVCINNDKNQ
jgi:hypothetical protein